MQIASDELAKYLTRLDPLIGDQLTKRTVQGMASRIIAGESLRYICIAAFSSYLSRIARGL